MAEYYSLLTSTLARFGLVLRHLGTSLAHFKAEVISTHIYSYLHIYAGVPRPGRAVPRGDPGAAHYRSEKMVDKVPKTLNFNDTFLNFEHLRQSFPMYDVKVDVPESELVPPFKGQLI